MPIGVSPAPYVSFENPGERHGGTIVDFRIVQAVDFDTKRPLYFCDGGRGFDPYDEDGKPNQPITQWEITVDTGEEDDNGDTERRIFLDPRRGKRGTALEGKRGGDAVTAAIRKAGAHRVGLEIGGRLTLTFTGKAKDGNGPKTNTWTAEYEPPVGGPGSGKPVNETIYLVGGGTWPRPEDHVATANPAARIPNASVENPADQGPAATFAEQRQAHDLAAATREATDQLARAHASSPLLNRSAPAATVFEEKPPF
ncbi:MAG TPA: hypothetical protein VFX60_19145 [Micromonospora sp.]|nr:hypothetical protein [Micromonospora sp.]